MEQIHAEVSAEPRRSEFARRMESDPELAARFREALAELMKAQAPAFDAIERSERLTREDLQIVINARADHFPDM